MVGSTRSLLLTNRAVAVDVLFPTLNSTLDAHVARPLILSVATHEYVPLLANLLCSIQQWRAAAETDVLVAAADSWLCGQIDAPSIDCIEPSVPTLAATAVEVYALKLHLAARAVDHGRRVLFVDCASVLLADPFLPLRDTPSSLLFSFQDRACLPWACARVVFAGRTQRFRAGACLWKASCQSPTLSLR